MIQNKQSKVGSRGRTTRNRKQRNAASRAQRDAEPQTIVRYSPSVFGFPHRLISKLRYHDTKTITSVAGIITVNVFSWNSLFDPDITNTGHQPLYYDTYGSVYDHYAVIAAKCRIQFLNPETSVSVMVAVTDDDGNSSTVFNTIAEQSDAKHQLLTPLSGSKSSHTLNFNWNCMEFLGIDPFTSQTYKTAIGSNPSENSTLQVFSATTTAANSTITYDIEFEYEVLFSELSTPTGS